MFITVIFVCFCSVDPDDLSLRMGEYDLGSDGEPNGHIDRKVQIVASHPKFDPKTFEYDLALLRFYEPVEFQPNIIPICIPEDEEDLVGETAWVTGWGRLYDGNHALTSPIFLMKKLLQQLFLFLNHDNNVTNTLWVCVQRTLCESPIKSI